MTSNYDLDAIAAEFGRLVSSVCRRMITDEDVAREAAQEVWVEITRSLKSFRGESKLSTWIFAITKRVALRCAVNERTYTIRFLGEYFRSGEEIEMPVGHNVDQAIWIRQMCDRCLTGTLHCLDNDARLAYILRDIAELSYHDIAVVLDRNVPSVRQTISRSRNRLRTFLNNECCLFAPQGSCSCRMKKRVVAIDLPREYARLRKTARVAEFLRLSGQLLRERNFWENITGVVTTSSPPVTYGVKKYKSPMARREKCVTERV